MTTLTPHRRRLGRTDLHVFPLCLGGNVFGWTADEQHSFAVLDDYVAAGGNFIDTADQYSNWVPGHKGGESETVIGRWMHARGNRDDLVIATKVGAVGIGTSGGLTAESIRRRTEASLARLGVDTIDLLYAHHDDPGTPLDETIAAFDALVQEGLVRWLGVSNYSADRLDEAAAVGQAGGWTPFTVLQGRYNVLERELYEDALIGTVRAHDLAFVPYWTLAKGFLTGKYRTSDNAGDGRFSDRASRHRVLDYATGRNLAILATLERIAAQHDVSVGAVALAWTAAQPTVTAPIASARTSQQLADLLGMFTLTMSHDELAHLQRASANE